MSIFIIPSAINTQLGNYDSEQRLNQTIETINSIRNKINSKIVLLECSIIPLSNDQKIFLLNNVDILIDYSKNSTILKINELYIGDMIKSLCELFVIADFLIKAKEKNILDSRIYKISGRHKLSENFTLHDFNDKIVLKKKELGTKFFNTETNLELLHQISYQYSTRLWSFDVSLTNYIIQKYNDMFEDLISIYDSGQYSDIEHMMYNHLDQQKIKELPIIGVKGTFASSKKEFNE